MLQRFFKFLLNQLFPLQCLGCGKDDLQLCDQCLAKQIRQPLWQDFDDLSIWSVYRYESGLLPRIVQHWKYDGDQSLLYRLTAQIVFPKLARVDRVVAVPLHRRRLVERGFNQAEQWAKIVAEYYNAEIVKGLARKRYTKPQAQLTVKERLVNLDDIFQWRGADITGQTILLVDDVVTTGSTLRESKKALQAAGAKKVIGICLLRGGRQD